MPVETRQVSGFDSVELKGVGDMHLSLGDTESLEIEADEDVLREIVTDVAAGRLVIRFDPWSAVRLWGTSRRVAFRIGARTLRSVVLNGAGTLAADGLTGERVELAVNGSGSGRIGFAGADLRLSIAGTGDWVVAGSAERAEFRIGGAGGVDARNLAAARVSVSIAGAGKAQVAASETLDVDIAGAGSVAYVGDPDVTQRVGGFGTVERIAEA